jgi:hypothetical protein
MKAQMDAWEASSLTTDDPAFADHPIHQQTAEFLGAWQQQNYGKLASFVSPLVVSGDTPRAAAGEMRELFESSKLTAFAIERLENAAPAVWLAHGTAVADERERVFECRWLIQDEEGGSGYGKPNGAWRMIPCSPWMILQKEEH